MTKRTAAYIRVSTSDQKSGLEAQARALKEHCERSGIADYELFADENVSGAKVSRPSLDRMMDALHASRYNIDTLMLYALMGYQIKSIKQVSPASWRC